jgi:hypothetical protein
LVTVILDCYLVSLLLRYLRCSMAKRYACRCCGFLTLDDEPKGSYEVCLVCFWEDDPSQSADPDSPGGANTVSLNTAKQNFVALGASEQRFVGDVRKPRPDEIPPTPTA